jgi:hypothetical protein
MTYKQSFFIAFLNLNGSYPGFICLFGTFISTKLSNCSLGHKFIATVPANSLYLDI